MSPQQVLPRLFVTGGSGFIGSRLARVAIERGHDVTVVTAVNNPTERARCEALEKEGINVLIAPLEDSFAVARALVAHEVVIHLAAAQHEAQAPESHFHQVNVEGTRRLLELAARAGVRRFVHGSTIGVYGAAARRILDEQSALAPDNPYGRTKAVAETVVRALEGTMERCIVRISETYGPGDMRLLKLFRGVQSGRYLTVGRGKNEHQLIYVDDLVRGLLAATIAPELNGETLVLAGSERVTTNAMVSAIAAAVGQSRRIFHAPMWPFVAAAYVMEKVMSPLGLKPPLHRRRLDFFRKSFRFSTAKAERLLGFRATTSFTEGARRTADWYRANGFL
jgi:nucleoside-diphosphate-sugar epimerase